MEVIKASSECGAKEEISNIENPVKMIERF